MSAISRQEPFSLPEFVAASIAIAVVAVVAFHGIRGSRQSDLSAANHSRLRPAPAAGSSLQVSQWRLDGPDPDARANRAADIVTSGKTGSPGRGPVASTVASSPRRAVGAPTSTFFAEAATGTIVEITMPDYGGSSSPLIGPPDLFHMKNAIVTLPAKPVAVPPKPTKDVVILPRPERRESR
jgi:hypothetical protein